MLKRGIEWDLALVDILAVALVFIVFVFPVPWLRIALGFPFIIFSPGYVLIAVLFPKKGSLSPIERIALSLGLSIAVVLFIGLMLNYTPWGIKLYPLLLSVSFFILLMSGIAWYARGRISSEERFSINLGPPLTNLSCSWRTTGKLYRSLTIVLLLAILGGSWALGHVMTKPVAGQTFSQR